MRNGPGERRVPWPAPAIEPSQSTPHSAFRIPHLLVGAAVLALLSTGCQGDGRTPLVEMHDPGEPPLQGGLLEAALGKGTYVYTGLSFFRQLPAGVPGAYRLFANLLALSKPK